MVPSSRKWTNSWHRNHQKFAIYEKKNIYENLFTLFFCLIKNKGNCSKQSAAPSIKLFRKNQKKYFIKKNKPRIFWWFRCHECIICLKVEGKYHLRLPHINSWIKWFWTKLEKWICGQWRLLCLNQPDFWTGFNCFYKWYTKNWEKYDLYILN